MTTNPAQIISAIYRDLVEWAASKSGEVIIARSPAHLVKLMSEPPATWRILLHWAGDSNPSEQYRRGNVVKNALVLILDGDLGMPVDESEALLALEGDTAFLVTLDLVRTRVLAYSFPWLNEPNNRCTYERTDDNVTLPDGYHLAGYAMTFGLLSTIEIPSQAIVLTPPEQPQTQGGP